MKKYIIIVGNYFLEDFYTDSDVPSLSFITELDFTIKKDRAFKFDSKKEASYMIDIICNNLEIYTDKTSFRIEEIEEGE